MSNEPESMDHTGHPDEQQGSPNIPFHDSGQQTDFMEAIVLNGRKEGKVEVNLLPSSQLDLPYTESIVPSSVLEIVPPSPIPERDKCIDFLVPTKLIGNPTEIPKVKHGIGKDKVNEIKTLMAMTQGFYPESPNADLQYITYGRYLNKKGIVEKYPSM
jgi:hypothetical protein